MNLTGSNLYSPNPLFIQDVVHHMAKHLWNYLIKVKGSLSL